MFSYLSSPGKQTACAESQLAIVEKPVITLRRQPAPRPRQLSCATVRRSYEPMCDHLGVESSLRERPPSILM
jgi:hypothetical protein